MFNNKCFQDTWVERWILLTAGECCSVILFKLYSYITFFQSVILIFIASLGEFNCMFTNCVNWIDPTKCDKIAQCFIEDHCFFHSVIKKLNENNAICIKVYKEKKRNMCAPKLYWPLSSIFSKRIDLQNYIYKNKCYILGALFIVFDCCSSDLLWTICITV